jgi:hypothetical protein
MSRLFLAALTGVILWLPWLSQSQEKPPTKSKSSPKPHSQLAVVETIKVPSERAQGFDTEEPSRCDVDGNFYLRVQEHVEPSIRRINAQGIQEVLFRPSSIPDLNVEYASYFSVRENGEIDQLVFPSKSEDSYIVTFKSDGSYKSKVKLQPGFSFIPYQLATFPSGEWLVTGIRHDDDPNVHVKWPFTGIFSSDGTLLKQITLKDDEQIQKMAAAGDPAVVPKGRHDGDRTIRLGAAIAAGDGNVYVMRKLSAFTVYAISPGGDVVRRFRIDPGNLDFEPLSMQVAGNRMAVLFLNKSAFSNNSNAESISPKDVILKVVDLEGHELATYDVGTSDMGIAFVCYAPPEKFTFLTTTTDNFLGFSVAEPR